MNCMHIYTISGNSLSVCLSVCLQFTLEWLQLYPRTHIYLESVSPKDHHEHVYMVKKIAPKTKKKVLLPEKRKELDPQTHIYLESVSPGEYHKHIYIATLLSVFKKKKKKKKKSKMVLFPEKRIELQA